MHFQRRQTAAGAANKARHYTKTEKHRGQNCCQDCDNWKERKTKRKKREAEVGIEKVESHTELMGGGGG